MDKPENTPKPHMRWDKKNAIIGLIVFVLLLGGGLAWYVLTRPEEKPVSQHAPAAVIDRALNSRDGATRFQMEEALKNNPTKEQKQQLLQLLSNEALQREDYQAAANYLRQTYESGLKTTNLVQSLATIYLEELNNKPEALKYFKLGIDLAEKNAEGDPFIGDIKKYMEEKIKDLEAEGVQAAK